MSKKKTENKDLQRMKAALDLYDNAPCGSISFQNDGLIFDINQTLASWLGYEKEELIHKRTLPSLFKIGGQIFFETHFFPLIKMQGFIKEVYFDIVKKDSSILHGLINVRLIPKNEDQENTYQATVLDISDRWNFELELVKAKQKAEADSKAKADFLSTISHEIRTPLNSILGIGNLLHHTPLNANQKEYARLLLHSSEHLLNLVNNLLDLSKIEAKKFTLEQVVFDINDLTTILQQTFSVKAKEKGIQLNTDLAENVPRYIIGDPVKLNQVLTNLLGNAVKFTKKGSVSFSISVSQESEDKVCLKFVVSDSGIGIPAEKLESIFHEFVQASYDVNVEFGGTGLGLTISKKLLELHDSALHVSSEMNVGSVFSFSIYYTKSQKPLAKETAHKMASENVSFDALRILLVDDNPANLFIAEQYLEQWNIGYQSAESGMNAIAALKKNSFDIILLDLQMPEMDGYETAKKIRTLKIAKQPVIIAFSASTKAEVSGQLIEVGIDDHLPKPFKPRELYDILFQYQHGVSKNKISRVTAPIQSSVKKSKKKPESSAQVSPNVSFNLDRYKKMANNKPEYLKKFKLSTLDAVISYQEDFHEAMLEKDSKKLSALIHQSTMSLYYIEADPLTNLLKECRKILKEDYKNDALLSTKCDECNKEFHTIIQGLRDG